MVKIIKRFLVVSIACLLVFIGYLKYQERHFLNSRSSFGVELNQLINDDSKTKVFNFKYNDIFTLAGKILLFNIYDVDDINYINNMNIVREIIAEYDNVYVVDVVYKDKVSEIDEAIINILGDGKINDFILKNNIFRTLLYMDREEVKNLFKVAGEEAIVLADFAINPKKVFQGESRNVKAVKKEIDKIIKDTKYIKKNYSEEIIYSNDELFVKSLKSIDYARNLDDSITFPVLFVADAVGKKVLVSSITGDVIYQVGNKLTNAVDGKFEDAGFCFPNSVKYRGGKLYVADSCDQSIRVMDFEKREVSTLVKSAELRNITDFEFIDTDKILISREKSKGLVIYDVFNNTFQEFTSPAVKVSNIRKHNDSVYYFDASANVLYRVVENNAEVVLKLSDLTDTAALDIKKFYITDDAYSFLDIAGNRLLIYNEENGLWEETFDDALDMPEDMVIDRDDIYILNNYSIKVVGKLNRKSKNVYLRLSKDTRNLRLLEEKFYKSNFKTLELNNDKITMVIDVAEGIKIEDRAPNTIYLLEKNGDEVILADSFAYNSNVKNIIFDRVNPDGEYILYGKIYYSYQNMVFIRRIAKVISFNESSPDSSIRVIVNKSL